MTNDRSTISSEHQRMLEQAQRAAGNAYVPYSNFRVGAAIRASSGAIYTGCNVENASYGLTICAERVACATALAAGERSFDSIAIWVDAPDGQPCGACRQFLREFGAGLDVVYLRNGAPVLTTIEQLLPDSFEPSSLP